MNAITEAAPVQGVAMTLALNPVSGTRKSGPKRHWTMPEIKVLKQNYPSLGLAGCVPLLPGRTAGSIYQRANQEGLVAPKGPENPAPRGKRQTFATNDHIDATIRRGYAAATGRGDIARLAVSLNRPRCWVGRRARFLGCITPRFKEAPWTAAELEIVQAEPHRHLATLKKRLARAGFTRSETAIKVKLTRLEADRTDPNHYTATGLSGLMGVDPSTVSNWCERGLLQAKRRGTDRVAAQGGDQWWIRVKDVRRFIIDHVHHVDVRKVDKFWFVDLLANGQANA